MKEGLHASTTFIPGYKYNVVTKQHNNKTLKNRSTNIHTRLNTCNVTYQTLYFHNQSIVQTYQQVEQKELEPCQTDYQTRLELEHLIQCMWADQLFLKLLIIMTKVTHTWLYASSMLA